MAVKKKKDNTENEKTIDFLHDDDYELNLQGKDEIKEKEIKITKEKNETTKDGLTSDLEDIVKEVIKNKNITELDEEINTETFNEDVLDTEKETIEEEISKDKKKKNIKIPNIMLIVSAFFGIIYYIIYVINSLNNINYFLCITNATIILLTFLLFISIYFTRRKTKEILTISASIGVLVFMVFNVSVKANVIKVPTLALLKDYTNLSLIEIINDCKKNGIELNQQYEYSDNISEGNIISQSVVPKTILREIKEISVVISNGPNYDKSLMLTDFVGLNVDNVLEFIDKNFMNNTTLNFDINNEIEKDIIVSQSTKGEIKRNTEVTFNVSLGSLESLENVKLDDLRNKSLFEAVLYLKRNGIKFELKYEFSSKIDRDYIISQNIDAKTEVKPMSDVVILTVSQGKEIKVPDFSGKTSDDVMTWIIENNLKVGFEEKYDVNIPSGNLIGINYEAGVSISEGTKIIIITSLGPIVVPSFNSLAEFRSWAQSNSINFDENYEYSSSISKGNIIKLSVNSGEKIDPTKTSITVTVSQGAAIVVPYFVGKNKSEIQKQCRNAGLNCTFYYIGYNNTAKDVATNQNVASGTKVISGTYVNIGLSSGPAQTFSVFIQGEWFQTTADNTISVLKSKLASLAPGVTFNFVKKSANTGFAGQIHDQSPIKGGSNSFTQGRTYTIWVIE